MPQQDLSRLTIERGVPPLRRRRLPRWPIVVAAAVLVGGGVYAFQAGSAKEVDSVMVTTAYPYQAATALNAAGYVVAQRKAAVASKATGRLEWLGVVEGSRVEAGQIIARLENRDVSAQAEQAAANVVAARASLQQALAEATDADSALRRARGLAAKRFISAASLDTAEARSNRAKAGVAAAAGSVAVAEAGERFARVAVDQTLIRAPFTGVVLSKSANVGDVITPLSQATDSKGAVVTMADMDTLEVEADVSESNLGRIHVGQPCEIQLDAFPEARLRGVVSRTVPTVDRAKATVLVKVRFVDREPQPGATVLPEMSAKVAFLDKEVPDTERKALTAVHADALVGDGDQRTVFVVADGRVSAVQVAVGRKINDLVAVTGVKVGDRVVLKPPASLADGDRVKIAAPK